jgi:hypothetical protein
MPPKKLINRSRPVGSRKPPKAPKPEPTPIPEDWSESKQISDWNTAGSTLTNGSISNISSSETTPSIVTSKAQSYTGLSQVGNALSFPKFDPNQYFATDLFKDTSALKRTTKETADDLVQSIEEKRQTVRVATANIQLNQDIVKAGNEYLKLEGLAIDYASTGVNNETKFVNYQVAGVNKEIAINKLDQAAERLTQGQLTLAGMQSITPLISQEWEQRRNLKLSQISSLKIEATKAREALEPKMMQLSQNFRQELEELN